MKNLVAISLIFLSFSVGLKANELNREYSYHLKNIRVEREAINFQDYKIIFLRGIFNNFVSKLSRQLVGMGAPLPKGNLEPWVDAIELMRKLGLDASLAPTVTEKSPSKNGQILARFIERSDKPVIIVSHSKGGIDALYGLTHFPQIHPKVAGWINLQAPIYGTALADLFQGNINLYSPLKFLLEGIMQGESKAFEDLSVKNMENFHRTYKNKIRKIVENFPVLSVGSTFEVESPVTNLFKPLSEKSAFEILNRLYRQIGGGPNDGFTEISRTCLKGGYCLFLKNIDHAALAVTLDPFFTFNLQKRTRIIFTMLKMLKNRML